MTLHLLKLCVGIDSLSDLADWQAKRLQEMARAKKKPELIHITRHMPKRKEEVLNGGSLYWVIKGWISARQRLLDLRPVDRDGSAHCGLVYDPTLMPVQLRPYRAFQGWRYLPAQDAPPDQPHGTVDAEMPEALKRELSSLGLL
jgi:hypothetical protein